MANQMYYEFRQNNSGGSFVLNQDVAKFVFIQAESPDQANRKAEEIGIYFDGCDDGTDCPCCGDRWYKVDEDDAGPVPKIWVWKTGETADLQAAINEDSFIGRGEVGAIVYHNDGRIDRFESNRTA